MKILDHGEPLKHGGCHSVALAEHQSAVVNADSHLTDGTSLE
jgi:hypothetical protein